MEKEKLHTKIGLKIDDHMKPLYVQWHLGNGDALLCNGLIRVLAERHGKVIIPSYPHNLQAVSFMFSDDPRIEVVEAQSSIHAAAMAVASGNHLQLGYYSDGKFDPRRFDQEFYSQANVPFSARWDAFKIPYEMRQVHLEEGHAFVHQDSERGFGLSDEHFPRAMSIILVNKTRAFFDWIPDIQKCEEIHVINSCFLILIDSLPDIECQKLFFHRYARPTDYPVLRKKWTILE